MNSASSFIDLAPSYSLLIDGPIVMQEICPRDGIVVIALVFVAMTAFWCFAARSMVNHPKLGKPIRRYGHRFAPIVLIGLGILIIYRVGSLGLLLRHGGF
jgi:cadmium resistance protein CadD (predicted permease)